MLIRGLAHYFTINLLSGRDLMCEHLLAMISVQHILNKLNKQLYYETQKVTNKQENNIKLHAACINCQSVEHAKGIEAYTAYQCTLVHRLHSTKCRLHSH